MVRGCVADVATRGCTAATAGSLAGASSVAVAPNGRRVYVAAYGAATVSTFARARTGRLRSGTCVADTGRPGCGGAPPYALDGTAGVAVSPDGADVYAASGLGRSLTRLSAAGAFRSCTADGGAAGCLDPPLDALAGASAVAVAPGGTDVYVTAFDGAAVSHFRRAADGSLILVDCLADAAAFGCRSTPDNVLEGASAIAIDGRDVYVTAFRSDALVRLRRAPGGALRYRGCVADDGANGCKTARIRALTGATALAVTRRRIYVAAQTGVVSAFTHALRLTACTGGGRCVAPRRATLTGASGVVVARGGVYVAAPRADAITRLTPGLGYVSAMRDRRLDGVYALAARGRDLYAASPTRATLTTVRLPSR